MRYLKSILALAEQIFLVMAVLCVAVMIIVNSLQIFFRYVLNSAFVWVYPLTMLLFIWMTFLGAYVVYRRKKDIMVLFIVNLMPASMRKVLFIVTNIATMILILIILGEAPTILKQQASVMQVIPLPRYTQAIPLFLGMLGIFLEYLVDTTEVIRGREIIVKHYEE